MDRRNFNSVDWMPEHLAKLGKYSDMEFFFKKKAKRENKTELNKENIRNGFKKNKSKRTKKNFEVDLYGKKKKGEIFGEKPLRDNKGRPRESKKRVSLKKEKKKKQKVYSSLTEILRRESMNERVSLKGLDSDYFDNIYQKLSTKLHTKKRGKKSYISKNKKKQEKVRKPQK